MTNFNKAGSGTNLLTINGGHTLDALEVIVGEIVEVDARTEIVWPTVTLKGTGEKSSREVPDQVSILGKTRSGTVFMADLNAGVTAGEMFRFEIRGSEGWLSLTSDHPYGFQAGEVGLKSNVAFTPPVEPAVFGAPATAINVGEVYASLVHDMNGGTYDTAGFQHALHNARLVEAVRRAAERGERQGVTS
jgi:predicted dehydrogenase